MRTISLPLHLPRISTCTEEENILTKYHFIREIVETGRIKLAFVLLKI